VHVPFAVTQQHIHQGAAAGALVDVLTTVGWGV